MMQQRRKKWNVRVKTTTFFSVCLTSVTVSLLEYLSLSQGKRLPALWWSQGFKNLFSVGPLWRQAAQLRVGSGWNHSQTYESGLQLPEEPAAQAQNITAGLAPHLLRDLNQHKAACLHLLQLAHDCSLGQPHTELMHYMCRYINTVTWKTKMYALCMDP